MSVPASIQGRRVTTAGSVLALLVGATAVGAALASAPLLGAGLVALAFVVLAVPFVDGLCVLAFWTLPYMAVNLPTGSFTLKICDLTAYLFAASWAVRALLRRERIAMPPATVEVMIFLAAMCLSAALAPAVPSIYVGSISSTNRNSPDLRSLSIIIWLGLAWLVVTALYNVLGNRPDLLRRCVQAHTLGAGLACVVSLIMYGLGLMGMRFYEPNGHSLVFDTGKFLRLAGVAYEPTFLGFYLTTSIPVTAVVWRTKPDLLPRRAAGLSLLVQCVAMLLTFSAGGWGSLAVAVFCLSLLQGWHVSIRGAVRVAFLVFAAAVIITTVFAMQPKLTQTVLSETLGKIAQGGDNIRKQEWHVGYGIMSDYPITGVGPGLARFYFSRYHQSLRGQPENVDLEINSLYVNTLAEEGVIGMAALIGCAVAGIAGLALPLLRFGPARVPVLCALFASLLGCAAQYGALNSLFLVYFTALVGLALATARAARLEYAARPPEIAQGETVT